MKDSFGFIERADVVKEIFFHYSEFSEDINDLILGDDVEFDVQTRNVSLFIIVHQYFYSFTHVLMYLEMQIFFFEMPTNDICLLTFTVWVLCTSLCHIHIGILAVKKILH